MSHVQGHIREAFNFWLEAVELGEASFNDKTFAMWNDEVVKIPQLLNSLSRCTDSCSSWVIDQYRGSLIGEKAWHTYANAVKVIRALRRQ